jgi:hypothetical protein
MPRRVITDVSEELVSNFRIKHLILLGLLGHEVGGIAVHRNVGNYFNNGRNDITSQKTSIFISIVVRSSNLATWNSAV